LKQLEIPNMLIPRGYSNSSARGPKAQDFMAGKRLKARLDIVVVILPSGNQETLIKLPNFRFGIVKDGFNDIVCPDVVNKPLIRENALRNDVE
jgi:hypothetical protein